jgi:hypothetical protein
MLTVRDVEEEGRVKAVTVGAVVSPEALPSHAIFRV